MQTPPGPPSEYDRYIPPSSTHSNPSSFRPYRLQSQSHRLSSARSSLSHTSNNNPHDLIADLSYSRLRVLADEAAGQEEEDEDVDAEADEDGLGMGSMSVDGTSFGGRGNTSSRSFHGSNPNPNRDHAVLLNLAAEQGNSGLLSLSPKLLGPPLNLAQNQGESSPSQMRLPSPGYGYFSRGSLKRPRYSEGSSASGGGRSSIDSPLGPGGSAAGSRASSMMFGAGGAGRNSTRGRDSIGSGGTGGGGGGAKGSELLRLAHARNLASKNALMHPGDGSINGAINPEGSEAGGSPLPAASPGRLFQTSKSGRKARESLASSAAGSDFPAPGAGADHSLLMGHDGFGFGDEEDEEEEEDLDPSWGMIGRMRTWRHDAIHQHLYETAAFWGDKIYTWTGEPNDAFWLAQAHFLMGHYLRAEKILTAPLPPSRMPNLPLRINEGEDDGNDENAFGESARAGPSEMSRNGHLNGFGGGNGKGKVRESLGGISDFSAIAMPGKLTNRMENGHHQLEEDDDDGDDQSWIGDLMRNTKGGVWGALKSAGDNAEGKRFERGVRRFGQDDGVGKGEALTEWSVACKYLAALCMIHQERFTDALNLIGESNPFSATGLNGSKIRSEGGDLKMEASLCRLRGVLYLRLNSLQMAKESYMEALSLDVRNYDVFNELVNEMMLPEEEWDFIQSLNYREQLAEEDAEFVKLVYTSRLNKTLYGKEISAARRRLRDEYSLGANSDIWVAAAEDLFAKYKFEECYLVTSRIISKEPGHAIALPLHLACLAQIPRLASSLFMLAHKLVEQEPTSPTSWYAVGLWYFTGQRWAEARRYFAATHDEDTRFAPAWITFAHSFAYEKEHEQAITAYSTTARLFPGSYFPHVCIGMEYLQLNQLELAKESFDLAYKMNSSDPLLLNELGVCCYNQQDYENAVKFYQEAVEGSKKMQGVNSIWAVTWSNLGHSYRHLERYLEAEVAYKEAIKLDALNVHAYTSLGMLAHEEGNVRLAIERYHLALSINPQDAIATYLLELCLPEQVESGAYGFPGLPDALAQDDVNPFDGNSQNRLLNLPIYLPGIGSKVKDVKEKYAKKIEVEESMDLSRDVSAVTEGTSGAMPGRSEREGTVDMDMSMSVSGEQSWDNEQAEAEDDEEEEDEGASGGVMGGDTISMEEEEESVEGADGSGMDFD